LTGIYAEKLHTLYGTHPVPWHELGAIENVIANIKDPEVVEHIVGKRVSLFSFDEKTGTVQMAYDHAALDKLLEHARAHRSDHLTEFAMRTDRSLWEQRLLGLSKVEDSGHPTPAPHNEKQHGKSAPAKHGEGGRGAVLQEPHGKKAAPATVEEHPKKKVTPAEQGRAKVRTVSMRADAGEQVLPQRGPTTPPVSQDLPGSPAYQARGTTVPIDTFPINQKVVASGSASGAQAVPASGSAAAPAPVAPSRGATVSAPAERVDSKPPAAPRVSSSVEPIRVDAGAARQQGSAALGQEEAVSPEKQYTRMLDTMQKKFAIPPRFMDMVDERTVHDFSDTIKTMLGDARKTNPGEVSAFMDEGSLSGLLKNLFAQSLERQDFVLPDELTSIDYHHLVKLHSILENKHPSLLDGKLTMKDFFLKKGI
jgi:hypothetical protein